MALGCCFFRWWPEMGDWKIGRLKMHIYFSEIKVWMVEMIFFEQKVTSCREVEDSVREYVVRSCFELSRIQEVRRNLHAIASLRHCQFGLVLLQTGGVQQSKGLFIKVIRAKSPQSRVPSCRGMFPQGHVSKLSTTNYNTNYYTWWLYLFILGGSW